jgi:hypothetical protein
MLDALPGDRARTYRRACQQILVRMSQSQQPPSLSHTYCYSVMDQDVVEVPGVGPVLVRMTISLPQRSTSAGMESNSQGQVAATAIPGYGQLHGYSHRTCSHRSYMYPSRSVTVRVRFWPILAGSPRGGTDPRILLCRREYGFTAAVSSNPLERPLRWTGRTAIQPAKGHRDRSRGHRGLYDLGRCIGSGGTSGIDRYAVSVGTIPQYTTNKTGAILHGPSGCAVFWS